MSSNDHNYANLIPGGEVVSTEAYFALDFQNTSIEIKDTDVITAVSAKGQQQCSIEAWVWLAERTDLGDDEHIVIAKRTEEWEVGVTGDGRPYCEFIVSYLNQQYNTREGMSLQAFSPERLSGGQWHYLTWVLNPDGSNSIFDGTSCLLMTESLSGSFQQWSLNGDSLVSNSNAHLALGSPSFIGKIRTLMTYRVARRTPDIEQSMFFAQLHALPQNAEAYVNLYHTSADPEDAEDPDFAVPLCCYVTQKSNPGHPKMIEIELPIKPGLNLVAITPARCIGPAGFLDCGLNTFSDGTAVPNAFTLDTWLMLSPDLLPDATNNKAIFSVGGWRLFYQHAARRFELQWNTPQAVMSRQFYARSPFDLQIGRWWHLCLIMPSNTGDNPTFFINGKMMPLEIIIWNSLQNSEHLAIQSQKYNLIIGAVYPYNANEVGFPSYEPETRQNWPGYFKLFRIWKQVLSNEQVVAIHHLDFEEEDMSLFYGYYDLDTKAPADLTGRNMIKCSMQTEYVEEAASVIPHTPRVNSTTLHYTVSRVIQMQRKDHKRTAMLSALPMLTAMPLAGPISTERLGLLTVLVSEIFVQVVGVITGAQAKGGLVKMLMNFFQNPSGKILSSLEALIASRSRGINAIARCLKDVLVAFYNSGILKKIFQYFTLGFFGLTRLVAKLVPGVGTLALLANLAVAAASILVAVIVYKKAIDGLDRKIAITDLDLKITARDDPDFDVRFPIKIGPHTTRIPFKVECDRQIDNDDTYKFALASVPANVLDIFPDQSLEYDRNHQIRIFTVHVNVQKADFLGQARVQIDGGRDLVTFDVVQDVLSTVQDQVVLSKENDAFTATVDSTWVGWLNQGETFGMRYRYLDRQSQEMNEEPSIEQLEIYDAYGSAKSKNYTASKKGLQTLHVNMKTKISGSSPSLKTIAAIKAQATINGQTRTRSSTKTDVKRNKIEEIVRVWMMFCGTGDQFYNQFERREYSSDGKTVTSKKAHMIIDGGLAGSGLNLFTEVPDEYLPPSNTTSKRRTFDLALLTHYDGDHAYGMMGIFNKFQNEREYYPGLTWMNASSAAQAATATHFMTNVFSSLNITETKSTASLDEKADAQREQPILDSNSVTTKPQSVIADRGLDPSTTEQAISIPSGDQNELAPSFTEPSVGDNTNDDGTDARQLLIMPWPLDLVGDPWMGDYIVNICQTRGYPVQFCPAITSVPTAFKDASAIITYRGPSKALADDLWASNKNSVHVNRASIIHTMESAETPQAFSALWTGDAHDTKTHPDIRESIRVTPGMHKHFTLMKVGHHGSADSNSLGFFSDVTADYYLVSGHGKYGLPTEETLNNIFEGYDSRRSQIIAQNLVRAAAKQDPLALLNLDGPRVYVSAPLDKSFTINTRGGHLYYRNQTDAQGREKRGLNPKKGSLMFTFVNGTLDPLQSAQEIKRAMKDNKKSYIEFPSNSGPAASMTKRVENNFSLLAEPEKESSLSNEVKQLIAPLAWASERFRVSIVEQTFSGNLGSALFYMPVENLATQRPIKRPSFVIWTGDLDINHQNVKRIVSIHSTSSKTLIREPSLSLSSMPQAVLHRSEFTPQSHIMQINYWITFYWPYPVGIQFVEQNGTTLDIGMVNHGECFIIKAPGPEWTLVDFWGYLESDSQAGYIWDIIKPFAPVWALTTELEVSG